MVYEVILHSKIHFCNNSIELLFTVLWYYLFRSVLTVILHLLYLFYRYVSPWCKSKITTAKNLIPWKCQFRLVYRGIEKKWNTCYSQMGAMGLFCVNVDFHHVKAEMQNNAYDTVCCILFYFFFKKNNPWINETKRKAKEFCHVIPKEVEKPWYWPLHQFKTRGLDLAPCLKGVVLQVATSRYNWCKQNSWRVTRCKLQLKLPLKMQAYCHCKNEIKPFMKFYSGFIYKYFNNFMKTFSNFDLFHTENISQKCMVVKIKVQIFWEGHKILRNLYLIFDWHYIGQK